MKRVWYHQFIKKLYGFPLYALSNDAAKRVINALAQVDPRIVEVTETKPEVQDTKNWYYIRETKQYVHVQAKETYPKKKVRKIIERM